MVTTLSWQACWDAAYAEKKSHVSSLHQEVAAALQQVGVRRMELEHKEKDYSVDIAVFEVPATLLGHTEREKGEGREGPHAASSGGAVAAGAPEEHLTGGLPCSNAADGFLEVRVAVEVDGPSHFTASVGGHEASPSSEQHKPLGPTVLKARLLERLGWQVVQVGPLSVRLNQVSFRVYPAFQTTCFPRFRYLFLSGSCLELQLKGQNTCLKSCKV